MKRSIVFVLIAMLSPALPAIAEPRDCDQFVSGWQTAQETELIRVYGCIEDLTLEQQQALLPELRQHAVDSASPSRIRAAEILQYFDDRVISVDERDRLALEVLVEPLIMKDGGIDRAEIESISAKSPRTRFFFPPIEGWEGAEIDESKLTTLPYVVLMSRPEKHCGDLITRCLADGKPSQRGLGVYIAALCDPLVALPVCQMASHDADPYVRFAAINAAMWIAFYNPDYLSDAQELILGRLVDDHELVRKNAAWWGSEIVPTPAIRIEQEREIVRTMRLKAFEERAAWCVTLNSFGCTSPAALNAVAGVIRDAADFNEHALGNFYEYVLGVHAAFELLLKAPEINDRCENALQAAMRSRNWRDTARVASFVLHGPTTDEPWEQWRKEIESGKSNCVQSTYPYRRLLASAPDDDKFISVIERLIARRYGPAEDVIASLPELGRDQAVVVRAARLALDSYNQSVSIAGAGVLLRLGDKEPRAYEVVHQALNSDSHRRDESFDRAVALLLRWNECRPDQRSLTHPLLEQVLFHEDVPREQRIPILQALVRESRSGCESVPLLRRILNDSADDRDVYLRRTAMRLVAERRFHDEIIDRYLLKMALNGRPSEQAVAREAIEALGQ